MYPSIDLENRRQTSLLVILNIKHNNQYCITIIIEKKITNM